MYIPQHVTQRVVRFFGSIAWFTATLAAGIGLVWQAVTVRKMRSWHSIPAVVTAAWTKYISDKNTNYYVRIFEYRYTVGQKEYLSSCDYAGSPGAVKPHWSTREEAAQAPPKVDAQITVRYSSDDPSLSVYRLDIEPEKEAFFGVVIVISAVISLRAIRKTYNAL